jgi:polyhydroxyalkanoate synthase subunit PhaC
VTGPATGGPVRRGPRPLLLHLQQALLGWGSARLAAECTRAGLVPWDEALRPAAAGLAAELEAAPPGELAEELARAASGRLSAFLRGVRLYRAHPWHRELEEPPVVWRSGAARLLDYRPEGGPPILVVPSLVNRAYILDLAEDNSLLRHLAAAGLRPLLLDWGAPGPVERGFGLDDYVGGPLSGALAEVRRLERRAPVLLGYCMGGLLALALAALRPGPIAGLALLATPWAFGAYDLDPGRARAFLAAPAVAIATMAGELPVDVLQALFASIDPMQVPRKFVRFAALDPEGAEARAFVAVEDWLNDGVPLAARVAAEVLHGWYVDDLPGRGMWRVAGRRVGPAAIRVPALVAVPHRDRIVPPGSALALAERLRRAEILRLPAGHVSMVAGPGAERVLWRPLEAWLRRIVAEHASRSSRSHR